MTHDELKDVIKHAFGGRTPAGAREPFGNFLRSRATSFLMKHEWVQNEKFYDFVYSNPSLEIGYFGDVMFEFWICKLGRVGHDK